MRRTNKPKSHGRGTCPFCGQRAPLTASGTVGSHTRKNGTRNVYCGGLGQTPKAA